MKSFRSHLAVFALAVTSSGTLPAAAKTLDIAIRNTCHGAPLLLDSLRYEMGSGETLSFSRVSMLLSGFALEREDGQWVELNDPYAWMDAAKSRNSLRITGIPEGDYRALRFHVGPDEKANHADISKLAADHPLNPNLNSLHWDWQGGYIFMAVEGYFRSGEGKPTGFSYHLARDPNRTRVTVAAPIDLKHDAAVQLDFDLGNLFNAPRPISIARDGVATHSRENDALAAALVANLQSAFRFTRTLSSMPTVTARAPVTPLFMPEKFTPYRFAMNATFPVPDLPRDNPLIVERVALGKALFHDVSLSRNDTVSCASCHQAESSFSDPDRFSSGVDGRLGTRNSMPLINLAWKSEFFWDGRAPSLRAQALMPIETHSEMDTSLEEVCSKLAANPAYLSMFSAAFGSTDISAEKVGLALEQFLLTLTVNDSKFDQALRGKSTLSDQERRGFELFMTEFDPRTGQTGADCFHCHGGPLFSDHQFHNNGLGGKDSGRGGVTGLAGDMGKFSTPTLRNIALTAPYMHDGRFATLEEVVAHYSSGIHRSETLDPNLAKHPEKGLNLSTADQAALVAFMKTLTVP